MKYCCKRFKEAIGNYEIKKNKHQKDIIYSLCVSEGIESRIYYCPWCGNKLLKSFVKN